MKMTPSERRYERLVMDLAETAVRYNPKGPVEQVMLTDAFARAAFKLALLVRDPITGKKLDKSQALDLLSAAINEATLC